MSRSFASTIRMLFTTPMVPLDPSITEELVEISMMDLSPAQSRAPSQHTRHSVDSDSGSLAPVMTSIPPFIPSTPHAMQIPAAGDA
ncbi:hypothetical protein PHLCEN_2v3381 [Hermanssonia centrifuga]|uniref:Uncharacterized protein n=1 Tax=Hermanssonia centrifuga TaxID=98765 RepID=A0A2R6QIW3_9APHY|nr:hypothetical protein PHLCEN_2v3381 [Hermanssonia centrifuga]